MTPTDAQSRGEITDELRELARAHQIFARDAVLVGDFPGGERNTGMAQAYSNAAKLAELYRPSPPAQQDGWRDIATAPKEHGHEILVRCDCPHMMAVVEWLDKEHVMEGAFGEEFVSGWYISDGHNDPIWFRANPYMTHWRELPSPPKQGETG